MGILQWKAAGKPLNNKNFINVSKQDLAFLVLLSKKQLQ